MPINKRYRGKVKKLQYSGENQFSELSERLINPAGPDLAGFSLTVRVGSGSL